MRRMVLFVLWSAMLAAGLYVLYVQFSRSSAYISGWAVFGGGTLLALGALLLWEDFFRSDSHKEKILEVNPLEMDILKEKAEKLRKERHREKKGSSLDRSPWWTDPEQVAAYLGLDDSSISASAIDIPRPDENWLQPYIEAALSSHPVCVRMHCGTCGARHFKMGAVLLASGSPAEADRFMHSLRVSHDTSLRIAAALARLDPPSRYRHAFRCGAGRRAEPTKFEWGVMAVAHMLWWGGEADFEEEVKPALAGTWAGYVVACVQDHHAASGGSPKPPIR